MTFRLEDFQDRKPSYLEGDELRDKKDIGNNGTRFVFRMSKRSRSMQKSKPKVTPVQSGTGFGNATANETVTLRPLTPPVPNIKGRIMGSSSFHNVESASRHHSKSYPSRFPRKGFGPPVQQRLLSFIPKKQAIQRETKPFDWVAFLDNCKSYDETPIWLCFRLWQYGENLNFLKKFVKMGNAECSGDDIADIKKMFGYHGMSNCLDCFMLEEEANMRNCGYIIDDDVLISFNNLLPFMTQYDVKLRDAFYGKSPQQNALIRQWLNYCVRNIRGRKVTEYMWQEMDDHLGSMAFFGGPFRTMADTLMYVSLYTRIKRLNSEEVAKRYNISRWFRIMQMDDKLRGANQLLEISRSSQFHPNYPFDNLPFDIPNPNEIFENVCP